MSNKIPTSKVTAAMAAGAAVTALLTGAQWLFGLPPYPVGLEGALVTLAAFGAGYIKKERAAP